MLYYKIFGMDENGQAYTFANETRDWTLKGVRQGSNCFGLCEMSADGGEHERLSVVYSWNPVDGYQHDPLGDVDRAYDGYPYSSSIAPESDMDEEEPMPSPDMWLRHPHGPACLHQGA
jgi:hypothetical protein